MIISKPVDHGQHMQQVLGGVVTPVRFAVTSDQVLAELLLRGRVAFQRASSSDF